jgi:flagellar motor protein MotB
VDEENDLLSFNFWPAFTDIMLSLLLIMVVVIFFVSVVVNVGSVNLNQVEKSQQEMVKAIELACKNDYKVSTISDKDNDIVISSDLDRQKITFSEHILFEPDRYLLTAKGRQALYIVGTALKERLEIVREIQIQGHADIDKTTTYRNFGNMELASYRAMAVFDFLQNQVGIDPARQLMSATSFGEFKPVLRSEKTYTPEQLQMDNITPELKNKNRRIELLIIYNK